MPLFTQPVMPAIISDDIAVLAGSITQVLTANTVYLRAFKVDVSTTIVAGGYRTGSTATGKGNVGIYTLAGNLVSGSDTGQITNAASSDMKLTYATPIVLPPGQYFVAFSPSNSTDTYMCRTGNAATANGSYRTAANALSAGALPSITGALSTTIFAMSSALFTQGGL